MFLSIPLDPRHLIKPLEPGAQVGAFADLHPIRGMSLDVHLLDALDKENHQKASGLGNETMALKAASQTSEVLGRMIGKCHLNTFVCHRTGGMSRLKISTAWLYLPGILCAVKTNADVYSFF